MKDKIATTADSLSVAQQDVLHQRLHNQSLHASGFEKPGDVVKWMGAVQAQEFLGALWSVGLRLKHATEADIEQAIADKTLIRTWPMRGTLHFVAPEDARWMLALLTPRILAGAARRYRELELEQSDFDQSQHLLTRALEGGKQLTRSELFQALQQGRVSTAGQRGYHILGHLAQKGVLCLGPRRGKQPTFVLLEEWIPPARKLEREEALAELTGRYFASHGPATLSDFAWWSGLTMTDVKIGLDLVKARLRCVAINGQTYWFSEAMPTANPRSLTAHLLWTYDEYVVAYKDRSALVDELPNKQSLPRAHVVFNPTLLINGRIVGVWKRVFQKKSVHITMSPFFPLTEVEKQLLSAVAERYAAFLGLSPHLSWDTSACIAK